MQQHPAVNGVSGTEYPQKQRPLPTCLHQTLTHAVLGMQTAEWCIPPVPVSLIYGTYPSRCHRDLMATSTFTVRTDRFWSVDSKSRPSSVSSRLGASTERLLVMSQTTFIAHLAFSSWTDIILSSCCRYTLHVRNTPPQLWEMCLLC